jgi:Transposase DDE domain
VWVKSGVFAKIMTVSIEAALNVKGNPESFIVDTSSSKSPLANFSGNNPTDRSKRGVKKSIVIDWNSVILSVVVDSANRHDSKLLLPHIDTIKKFVGEKPKVMSSDSAWDVEDLRKQLAKCNIALHASTNVRRSKTKRKIQSKGRWKIEQIFGIQQWNRGIKFCWTKTNESFLALCQFASSLHNFRLAGIFG